MPVPGTAAVLRSVIDVGNTAARTKCVAFEVRDAFTTSVEFRIPKAKVIPERGGEDSA